MALLKIAQPHARAAAARGFHALSDDTRLRIVDLLRDGERCVCELQDWLGMSQSALSFHLKTMKDAELLSDRRQGRWVYYRLNPAGLAALQETFSGLIKYF